MDKHWYVQEHEVFGDGDRVIWTSENLTEKEANVLKDLLTDANDDTWFTVVRDFEAS